VSSSTTEAAALVDVTMPAMGTSITEGTVIGWSKAVGDRVERDETICEISTDKVDSECPAPAAGAVAELLVDVGETVEVGTVLARIASDGPVPASSAVTPPADAPASPNRAAPSAAPARPPRISPVVARIAADKGIDLTRVAGTGRGGRITKRDVLAYAAATRSPPERPLRSESPYRPDRPQQTAGEPLSRMRQSIGKAMLRSQQTTATCHTVVESDMSVVEQRRRELGLSPLPLVARAVVDTLREFPDLNARLEGDTITRFSEVHLGIAVSLGADGLIVPVIREAQDLAPEGLGRAIKDLAARARSKQLTPDEVQGATFTITNPGAAGAIFATPVIDVPQVGILDLEAIVRRPVVVTTADGSEGIAIRPMANLILGWDHRAMDGIYAAQFLTALRHQLETADPAAQ
jgi:pyruvate dehydrogenase E2 component (dihydrolipoyllysine-residue acetyltransferase)